MALYAVNVSINIAEQESNIVETTGANLGALTLTGDVMLVVNKAVTVNKDEIMRAIDAIEKGVVQSVLLAG